MTVTLTSNQKELLAMYFGYGSCPQLLEPILSRQFLDMIGSEIGETLTEIETIRTEHKTARKQQKAYKVDETVLNPNYRSQLNEEASELVLKLAALVGLEKHRIIRNYFDEGAGSNFYSVKHVR